MKTLTLSDRISWELNGEEDEKGNDLSFIENTSHLAPF